MGARRGPRFRACGFQPRRFTSAASILVEGRCVGTRVDRGARHDAGSGWEGCVGSPGTDAAFRDRDRAGV